MKANLLFSSFPFISGGRVTLSRMSELDLRGLWSIMSNEENFRFTPTGALRSPEDCAKKLRQAEALFRDKEAVVLGVYPQENPQRIIGYLEMANVKPEISSVSVSLTIGEAFWRRGYGSAALQAACAHLMGTLGVNRIEATVLPTNQAGIALLESCRFQREGIIREGFLWPDKGLVDLCLYSLLPIDLKDKPAQPQRFYL